MGTVINKWKKGDTIVIDGSALLLTGKPKKAIDGTYIVFGIDSTGKVIRKYVGEWK
jgi:hypothetical protein